MTRMHLLPVLADVEVCSLVSRTDCAASGIALASPSTPPIMRMHEEDAGIHALWLLHSDYGIISETLCCSSNPHGWRGSGPHSGWLLCGAVWQRGVPTDSRKAPVGLANPPQSGSWYPTRSQNGGDWGSSSPLTRAFAGSKLHPSHPLFRPCPYCTPSRWPGLDPWREVSDGWTYNFGSPSVPPTHTHTGLWPSAQSFRVGHSPPNRYETSGPFFPLLHFSSSYSAFFQISQLWGIYVLRITSHLPLVLVITVISPQGVTLQ
ncbi:hypothetical protein HD554DRAFT_1338961 [Boletus coccyginus]|nr:hypothetical protein HD554DRAFT_1338961 [Boletus coccyginus]